MDHSENIEILSSKDTCSHCAEVEGQNVLINIFDSGGSSSSNVQGNGDEINEQISGVFCRRGFFFF